MKDRTEKSSSKDSSIRNTRTKDSGAKLMHQSSVDYDMAFRILRYIVQVPTDSGEKQEKKKKRQTLQIV